jgi:hypothetical protein
MLETFIGYILANTMTKKKIEFKIWTIYFTTILFSVYVHEFGHCIPAWINGYWAVPTPAKEYISDAVPVDLKQYISLGGIIGSIVVSLIVMFLYIIKTNRFKTAILAGAIATPGMYTLRFLLSGRGHDATEFQEAQSALGLDYSGNSLDWIFLILFVLGIIIWIIKSKPGYRIIGRLSIGFVLTIIFMIGLQVINNAIFDPIFQSR